MSITETPTAGSIGPRPDLNGLRVRPPQGPAVFLVDRGDRRWIPNPETYNNLFRDWNGTITDLDADQIPQAAQLDDGAILIRGAGQAPVYLTDQGRKRWVTSPAAMDKYYFDWNKIVEVPPIVVNSIPDGDPIS